MPVTIGTQGKEEIDQEEQDKKDLFTCPNCSRPFRHRSGFFNCRGCGGFINIDDMKRHPENYGKAREDATT